MVNIQPANDQLKEIFALNLGLIMEKRGISIDELSEEIGYGRETIKNWLNPRQPTLPYVDAVVLLSRALRVSADYLLGANEAGTDYEWIEQFPDEILETKNIQKGIEFFKHLVVDKRPASELGMNWLAGSYSFRVATASRCLVITHVPRDMVRERKLQECLNWPQERIYIASLPQREDGQFIQGAMIRTEFVCILAVKHIFGSSDLANKDCGLGPGYTMLRCVELAPPSVEQFAGTTWIPLMAIEEPDRDTQAIAANYTAMVMATRQQQSAVARLPFIPLEKREHLSSNSPFSDEGQAAKVSDMLKPTNRRGGPIVMSVGGVYNKNDGNPDTALTGFTSYTLQDIYGKIERKEEFASEILGMMLNHEGELISDITQYNRQKIYTPLEPRQLRDVAKQRPVWIVAAGQHKCEPVYNAVRNCLANGLVIDSEIAQYLIERLP